MRRFLAIVPIALLLIGSLLYRSIMVNRYARDIGRTHIGLSEAEVVNLVGTPSRRETRNHMFARYAATPCVTPCHIRLWWEAPLLPGLEAWSVEFDATGKAIKKSHWVSPLDAA